MLNIKIVRKFLFNFQKQTKADGSSVACCSQVRVKRDFSDLLSSGKYWHAGNFIFSLIYDFTPEKLSCFSHAMFHCSLSMVS